MAFNWRFSKWKCSRNHINTFENNPFRCGTCGEPVEDRGGLFYHFRQYLKNRRERTYARQGQQARAQVATPKQRRPRRNRGQQNVRTAVYGPQYGQQAPPGGYVAPSYPFQGSPANAQRERELALKQEEVKLRAGERERGLRQEEVYRMTGPFKTIRYYIARSVPYLLILLLIGIAYLYIFASQRAEFREALGQRFDIIAERLNLANTFKEVFKYLTPGYIEQVVTDVGSFERNPTYAVQESKGVTVEYFRPIKPELFERQPILLDAKIVIEALPDDDAKVSFGCFIEQDNTTDISYTGTIEITRQPPGENVVLVKKGKDRIVNVKCIFKDGIQKIQAPEFKDYVAYLTWTYEGFITRTVLNPYLLRSETLAELEAQNRDPLESQKDIGTDVSSDGFSIPHCISGCGLVDLRLSLQTTLPVTEIGTSFLLVDMKDKQIRKGDITKLHSITLTLPQEHIQLGPESCPEIGNRLSLQEPNPFLTSINAKLANNEKPLIQYYCELKANPVGTVSYPVVILAEATYDYGDKYISNRFKIRKPGSDFTS